MTRRAEGQRMCLVTPAGGVRVVRAPTCAECDSARHPTAAHHDLEQALLAAKRALRAGRYHEAEAFVDVARRLAGGRL